ncbi:MAG: UvrD-helicase domain-containing protein [Nitrosomonadales bacterium]|nr:UvrD-helicase domain-containing protein [Nitrosomonadales bacterium]
MSMNNKVALDPQKSVVVEACAGSGKTWLLVSRIVRLLLAGVKPGEILAITFTRKAAQEMQARLHEWLHFLAVQDDEEVKKFLRERALDEIDDAVLARARGLYRDFLLAQPAITINTFHGWFMQIIQCAPLNSGVPVGMQLLERTAALREEAWQAFADSLRAAPEGETAQAMQWLFTEYGLYSTRALLENFVHKRAEWWAYTNHLPSPASGRGAGGEGAVAWAVEQLRGELQVDLDADPVADACADASLQAAVQAFAQTLASGTETQCGHAGKLQAAWELADARQRFAALSAALYTQADEPRSFKPTKKQNAETFLFARDALFGKLQAVRDALAERAALRMNQAALHCGAALLEHYQELKLRSQQMDFTDLEWQVCRLLNQSDCAEYMQYKLDSRYKHVLLDEFQDTNPLQWQILQAWFSAAAAVDARPTVFVVGDPKQSIYRFRRADARLFGVVREFLQLEFGAHYLTQNETRRNAPAVLEAVNGVFAPLPDGFVDFEEHIAHHQGLPGHVEVLPLAVAAKADTEETRDEPLSLRNPLVEPRAEVQSGAREMEAEQFAAHIANIVAHWSVQDEGGVVRRAAYRDIMVLVRKRIHLRVYEHALRARHIPFLTSRRGGLLDTLEAGDIQALLTFLITPFADLELAQALRSPLFACSDEDLMQLAADAEGSWWSRLQRIAQSNTASPDLLRAHRLLQSWLGLADKLPVHDLLDRIYFEGDLLHRYAAALPAELHETVRANLQAFMEIALNVDAGRYPSLPRFLAELRELRAAENEAPDEGRVGEVGNALRIYTVHEAKGLEAPIVWLLDANDTQHKPDSYGVLLDWPPNAPRPAHFSLFSDKRGRGVRRAPCFDADEAYARREEMNLLYVAMTRAKQALLVSGNGEPAEASWYGRIAQVAGQGGNPLLAAAHSVVPAQEKLSVEVDAALLHPLPVGQHAARMTGEQRRGIWLHALLQHLVPPNALADKAILQQRFGIPSAEMESLWRQAHHLLALPALQRYFDPQHYRSACNEMPYVNARGELKRIDRLVEFDDEVWVLDYKTGETANPAPYRTQMLEYRTAMQAVYAGKTVRCALLFADGTLCEAG